MFNKNLSQVWEQLRGKKPQFKDFLNRVTIRGIRGIKELPCSFDYPVTVLAGPNGCGKSTVLFACACAYDSGIPGKRDMTPTILFPNLTTRNPDLNDIPGASAILFDYTVNGSSQGMDWKRNKNWDKSYRGRKGGSQPIRDVYLRTLADLTSPSEVRSVLQIGKRNFDSEELTVDLISMAQRILSYRYGTLTMLRNAKRDLLFAKRSDGGAVYSEFHMSAGERSILRLSKDISQLKGGLVLINEIEAGLHPYTQQLVMLELQRLALRNDLQIIVTSHSATILDCVPIEGRIFLERSEENVQVKSAYKTVIQKAYYGQSIEKLSILCEDEMGEGFVRGCLDYLNPKLELIPEDVVVGRDTGKTEFPAHIKALAKFNKLSEFLFVLDGDARSMEGELKSAASGDQTLSLLFLPGENPEAWCWSTMKEEVEHFSVLLSIGKDEMKKRMESLDSLYDAAPDKEKNKIKAKFSDFCFALERQPAEIVRLVAHAKAEQEKGSIQDFLVEIETRIRNWIARK